MDRRWLCLGSSFLAITCSDIPVNHDLAEECGCVAEPMQLIPIGGPVETTMTVAPCRTFKFDVKAFADRSSASCTMSVSCPAKVTGVMLAKAVQHADVQAALRSGGLFGAGPDLAEGGGIYHINVGAAQFEVAAPCGGSPGCTPIPPGVQAFLDALVTVSTQESRRSPCREALNL